MKNDCKECINSKRMEIVTKCYMKEVLVVCRIGRCVTIATKQQSFGTSDCYLLTYLSS